MISELSERQDGVVAAWQLAERDVGAGAIKYRLLRKRMHPYPGLRGVYFVGDKRRTRRTHFWAAVLFCGDGALLSHRSCCEARGLLDPSARTKIDVTPARHRAGNELIVVHRPRGLHPDDIAEVDGLPATSVARTLLDLADTAGPRLVEIAIERALKYDRYDQIHIDALLARTRGRKGLTVLKAAVAHATRDLEPTESHNEELLLAIITEAGLPEPVRQLQIAGYRADFAWPSHRLIAEADSTLHHLKTPSQIANDRTRDRAHRAAGWRVRRFRYAQILYEPDYVERALRRLLGA